MTHAQRLGTAEKAEDINPGMTEIRALFTEVKQRWQMDAQRHGNRIAVSVKDDTPTHLNLDSVRVKQCIGNLVSNAIKFTKDGHIQIIADCFKSSQSSYLRVAVRDTGSGMDYDQTKSIFDDFNQANLSTGQTFGSGGRGLNIVNTLVKKMGGTVKVESMSGIGSTFVFAVKIHSAAPKLESVALRTSTPPQDLAKLDILFAEDNNINAQVLTAFLKPHGSKLTRAHHGQQAVNIAGKRKFDIILMDIQMPIMNGVDACELIKSPGQVNMETPVVAVTANVTRPKLETYKAVGMVGVCAKPYTAEQLIGEIKSAVGKSAATARA